MEDILDVALDSLDMLSTVTNARKEYLTEMRLRGVRSLNIGGNSLRRNETSSLGFTPTKENLAGGFEGERTVLYCAAGSNKMFFRRQKLRPMPYDLSKRKPLNILINPMSRLGLGEFTQFTSRSRSSDSYSESSSEREKDNTLPTFDDYQQLPFRDALNYTKTEKFPIPLLSRSKSLEDLRESPHKPRSKTVRFHLAHCDDNSNGTASSSGSNSVESPLLLSPRTSFLNVLKCEANIKNEIESMSMLIEKLDVA